MDAFERFKRFLFGHIYSLVTVFFMIFMLSYSLTLFNWTTPFSFVIMFSTIVMFMGQVLLLTPFGFTYPFYTFSFTETIFISLLDWFSSHMPFFPIAVLTYFVSVATLITVPLAIHLLTKKRIGTIPMIPILSIFFFGLLIVLSNAGTLPSTAYDSLFLLAIVLFILTSIFGLNIAYRTMILNKELKVNDRNQYLRKIREDLLEKYTSAEAREDIDLLIYYLSSSLDSFVYGDFDRSYMDAFKIIDNRGTAFKTIYSLPMSEEKWKHFKGIRNNLSHARITEGRKEEGEEELQKLQELEKRLFTETLGILKIVRFQLIDTAIREK